MLGAWVGGGGVRGAEGGGGWAPVEPDMEEPQTTWRTRMRKRSHAMGTTIQSENRRIAYVEDDIAAFFASYVWRTFQVLAAEAKRATFTGRSGGRAMPKSSPIITPPPVQSFKRQTNAPRH